MPKPVFPNPDGPRPGQPGGAAPTTQITRGLHHGMRPDTYVGYDLVVTLEDRIHRKPLKGYTGALIHIPMKDDLDQVIPDVLIWAAVSVIKRVIAAGGRVLVHCEGGINRSSVLVAAYLMSKGRTARAAIAEIRARRSPDCLCNTTFYDWVLGRE